MKILRAYLDTIESVRHCIGGVGPALQDKENEYLREAAQIWQAYRSLRISGASSASIFRKQNQDEFSAPHTPTVQR